MLLTRILNIIWDIIIEYSKFILHGIVIKLLSDCLPARLLNFESYVHVHTQTKHTYRENTIQESNYLCYLIRF